MNERDKEELIWVIRGGGAVGLAPGTEARRRASSDRPKLIIYNLGANLDCYLPLRPKPKARGATLRSACFFCDDPRMLVGTSLVLGVLASGVCFTKKPTTGAARARAGRCYLLVAARCCLGPSGNMTQKSETDRFEAPRAVR